MAVRSTMAAWNFAMAHGARSLKMKGRMRRSFKAPACSQRTTSSPRAWAANKGEGAACWFPVEVSGRSFLPNQRNRQWKTNPSQIGNAPLVRH